MGNSKVPPRFSDKSAGGVGVAPSMTKSMAAGGVALDPVQLATRIAAAAVAPTT